MSKKNTLGLADHVVAMLADADKRSGFPAGTMASLLQQEVGRDVNKYLSNPSEYHYPLNAEGKRIAKHSNVESTAFGPFGIVESTAKKPGFGVKPLQNKSFDEQLRFASEYLAARSKQAGGLDKGLAGYGEGKRYAREVQGRISPDQRVPVQEVAPNLPFPNAAPVEATVPLEQAKVQPIPEEQLVNPWAKFQQATPEDITPNQLDYMAAVSMPKFNVPPPMAIPEVNFAPFKGWGRKV